jgi:hypothetical protein
LEFHQVTVPTAAVPGLLLQCMHGYIPDGAAPANASTIITLFVAATSMEGAPLAAAPVAAALLADAFVAVTPQLLLPWQFLQWLLFPRLLLRPWLPLCGAAPVELPWRLLPLLLLPC